MTRETFAYALNYIDEGYIEKAVSYGRGRERLPMKKPVFAYVCIALALILAAGAVGLIIKGGGSAGVSVISGDPQILYYAAATLEKTTYGTDEEIPVIIRLGTDSIGEYVDEMTISYESKHLCVKEGDPVVLRADNGDYDGAQLVLSDHLKPDKKRSVEELPFRLPLTLTVKSGAEGEGQIDITVMMTGVGFSQGRTVTLYYKIDGSVITFSSDTAKDAHSRFENEGGLFSGCGK
ncbi:MAG: hypothetical protein J5772_05370 [Clostridia bacterium]|nr:hypothetical protein [Clostridia bacterium]